MRTHPWWFPERGILLLEGRKLMTINEKLTVLAKIAEALNHEHITWGVGASLLLYFHQITDDFHDIDLMTTEEDVDKLKKILEGMGTLQLSNPNAQYHSRHFFEFVIDGVDIDVMEGFVIVKDGQEYDCSFSAGSVAKHITFNGQDIPLQSVADWRRYYELMGRNAKVEMIDMHEAKTV